MMRITRRAFACGAGASVLGLSFHALAADLPDYSKLDLAEHDIEPPQPQRDEKTGFIVGGQNKTALIERLTEIAGRSIAELEADMRPGAKVPHGSDAGFLGPDESLLKVLAADNAYVVDQRKLTHQTLARHLHVLGIVGDLHPGKEFRYHGGRFRVETEHTRGYQLSPFLDGTKSGSNAKITNLDNGKSIHYGLLVPYMIERYGFYEGEGTEYRLAPKAALAVLDFL